MEATLGRKLKLQESRPALVIGRLLQGRGEWKRKCREAKVAIQGQRVRIRDLEVSRDQWRKTAELAESEKRQLELELATMRQAIAERESGGKKK